MRQRQQVEVQSLFAALSLVWPLDGSTTNLTGMLVPGRRGASRGESCNGASPRWEKEISRLAWGQPGLLAASAVAPSWSCHPSHTIKVPFPVWTEVRVSTWTLPHLAPYHPRKARGFAAQNSFIRGSPHRCAS